MTSRLYADGVTRTDRAAQCIVVRGGFPNMWKAFTAALEEWVHDDETKPKLHIWKAGKSWYVGRRPK